MNRILATCLIVVASCPLVFSQQRPIVPLHVAFEAGEVAQSGEGKISLLFIAEITKDSIDSWASLESSETMGGKFRVPSNDFVGLSAALSSAAAAVLKDASFSATVGLAQVSTDTGLVRVVFEKPKGSFSISSDQFALSADNAEAMARLLSRANENLKWLAPKLPSLQK